MLGSAFHSIKPSREFSVSCRDLAATRRAVLRPEEVLGLLASILLLLKIEQDLLYDQATETVADENDRPALETRLAQQDFEDINGPVLQRHGGAKPIGCRSLVSHGVDRNSVDVLGHGLRAFAASLQGIAHRVSRSFLHRGCWESLNSTLHFQVRS
jgi:hypothetical protein